MTSGSKDVSFSEDVVQSNAPARVLKGTSSYSHFTGDKRPVAMRAPKASIEPFFGADGSESPSPSTGAIGHAKRAAAGLVNYLHRQPRESRAMAETLNPVERDGLVENIYELLRSASTSRDGHTRFTALRLPDTVIIRNGLIYKWYFTSKNGSILRKNRSRLHREEVRDALLAKGSKNRSKIVAVYLTSATARSKPRQRPGGEECLRPVSPTAPDHPEDTSAHTPVVHCDYLDAEQLRLFLDDDVLQRNGILQSFVEPNTDRMSTIEATYSPATTLIERRLNVNKLDDYRFPAVERMVTFDGADHYSDLVPVQRPQTVAALKDGCHAIKEHIAGVDPFYLDVGRMVLYLREDSKRQVWLLWCTSFRCTPRPDDPTELNHGPLALHTRMTVDKSGEQGSTRRREKAAGVGSTNLEEKSRMPTTGVVVQDPSCALRDWGPEVATERFTEQQRLRAERRHLVYNIPPVGLLDVLFEPGASATAGKPEGFLIEDGNGEDGEPTHSSVPQKPEKRQRKSAPLAASTVTKISDSEKHRSTRLTKGMQLASGELYNDALMICQTAPDLEALKSAEQRGAERSTAAQTLWSVADEKAREREALRAKLLSEKEEKKKVQQQTYNVRMLKKHRGIDGVNVDISLTLDDLASAAISDDDGVSPAPDTKQTQNGQGGAVIDSRTPSLVIQVPHVEEEQDPSSETVEQLGCKKDQSPDDIDPELRRELEMLRGLPRNHPTMLEFIRRQRQRIAKGDHLVIKTDEANKKAAERKARITRASMGRTDMQSQSPNKITKDQLLEVTRRHTNKLPKRRPSEAVDRPGSAPATSVGVPQTTHQRLRRLRPVSANASATTATRWGVRTGKPVVDEFTALKDVADRHSKAIKAAGFVPKQHRPMRSHGGAITPSDGGRKKQAAPTRAHSAGTRPQSQQRVPVPPAAENKPGRPESAPSRRVASAIDPHSATEIAAQRKSTSEQRYRKLLGYDTKPKDDGKPGEESRPTYRHRQIATGSTRASPKSHVTMRPRSAAPVGARPSSARPISSAFGDSEPTSARANAGVTKRRAQSARVRTKKTAATVPTTVRARPQSAVVPGKMASPRSRQTVPSGDAWLENVLVQTQSLIASVKQDQELYTAEADALQGQLYERAGMNIAAYNHVRVPH